MKIRSSALALAAALLLAPFAHADDASLYRRYNTKDGKTFKAVVQSKTDASVNFLMENGRVVPMPIRDLSDPDQQFVRKWTKLKDDLLRNAEFAKLTVQDILELVGYQSFEFDLSGNHIFVEGLVSGKTMKLMVDTGAQTTVFHDASAKDAGLEIGAYDQWIYGVAGKQEAAVVSVPSIKLGEAQVTNRKYIAADLFKAQPGARDFDGILGADFLREWDAVISYREGRMFLKVDRSAGTKPADTKPSPGAPATPAAAGKQEFRRWTSKDGKSFYGAVEDKTDNAVTFVMQNGAKTTVPIDRFAEADADQLKKWSKLRENIARSTEFRRMSVRELLDLRGYQSFVYRLDGNHIMVDGNVNESKARFLIDTGAHGGVLYSEFAVKAKVDVGPYDQKIIGIGGEAPAALAKVTSLTIGDAVIRNRTLLAADLFKQETTGLAGSKNYDAIFGADFLRELDGVVNYKENRIFLKPDNSDAPGAVAKPAGEAKEEMKKEK